METFHWDGKVELRRLCLKTVRRPSAEAPPIRCRSRGGEGGGAIESGPEAFLGLIDLIRLRRSVLFRLTPGRLGVIL